MQKERRVHLLATPRAQHQVQTRLSRAQACHVTQWQRCGHGQVGPSIHADRPRGMVREGRRGCKYNYCMRVPLIAMCNRDGTSLAYLQTWRIACARHLTRATHGSKKTARAASCAGVQPASPVCDTVDLTLIIIITANGVAVDRAHIFIFCM